MRTLARLAIFLVGALVGLSCTNPNAPSSGERKQYPSKGAVIKYLKGLSISLGTAGKNGKNTDISHTIREGDIEVLEVRERATRVNNGPWRTTVTFILNTGKGRYAVKGWLDYRIIENKEAFFGFEAEETARQ